MTHKKIGPSSTHQTTNNKKQKRRCGMNRIQRLQEFIDRWEKGNMSPFIKQITPHIYEYNKKELIKEYIKAGKHPYPHEYEEWFWPS